VSETEYSVLRYISLRGLFGGTAAMCERMPAAPGVYAWFRTVHVPANRGESAFVEAIAEAIEAPAAPDHSARLGPMHSATLQSRSELSASKRTLLEARAEDPTFRNTVARVVEAAAVLQAPLYVGKAQDLQQRIRQHLEPMSDLSVRLRAAGIRIDDCTLAYTVLDEDLGWDASPQELVLIEEIVTRICRPGFVMRPG
jgi:hypothetical protein